MKSNLIKGTGWFSFLTTLLILSPQALIACEPCALYSATEMQGLSDNAWRVSLYEQYLAYKKSPSYQENSIRDGELVESYSTTQLSIAYDFSERFGAQFTLPIVHREFDKIKRYRKEGDSETGIGDISLAGFYSLITNREGTSAEVWNIFAGIKFPTGDTGSIEDSLSNEEGTDEAEEISKHHPVNSGIGGSIVTMGTGSYDFPLGTSLFLQRDRLFLLSGAQYTIRTEGDFDYQFDNDLLLDFGPGYFLAVEDEYSIALRATASAEFKGRDQQDGESVYGSEVQNWFLGPELVITSDNRLSGEMAVDFVLDSDDTSPTVVPEYRLRAAINYQF